MATKNFVPRATGQGQIGTTSKKWLKHNAISGSFTHVSASVIQVTSLLGDISGSTSSTGSFGALFLTFSFAFFFVFSFGFLRLFNSQVMNNQFG